MFSGKVLIVIIIISSLPDVLASPSRHEKPMLLALVESTALCRSKEIDRLRSFTASAMSSLIAEKRLDSLSNMCRDVRFVLIVAVESRTHEAWCVLTSLMQSNEVAA